MGLDIIREPRHGIKPAWLLTQPEIYEVLATHAGFDFGRLQHWLSSTILSPDAIGHTVGARFEGLVEDLIPEALVVKTVCTLG